MNKLKIFTIYLFFWHFLFILFLLLLLRRHTSTHLTHHSPAYSYHWNFENLLYSSPGSSQARLHSRITQAQIKNGIKSFHLLERTFLNLPKKFYFSHIFLHFFFVYFESTYLYPAWEKNIYFLVYLPAYEQCEN